jgi:hypothetical protein
MASDKLEKEEEAKKLRDRTEKISMLVTIACGFVGAGAGAVGAGYLADYFDAPKCATYLSSAAGTFAGFFGGLYLGDRLFNIINRK